MSKYSIEEIKFAIFNVGQFYVNDYQLENNKTTYDIDEAKVIIKEIIERSFQPLTAITWNEKLTFDNELYNVFKAIDYIKSFKIEYFEDIEILYKMLIKNTPYENDELWNKTNENNYISVYQQDYYFEVWNQEQKQLFKQEFKKNLKSKQGLDIIYTSILTLQPFKNANKRIANLIAFSYFYHNKQELKINPDIYRQPFDYMINNFGCFALQYEEVKINYPNINFKTNQLSLSKTKSMKKLKK